jgi:hypothetical protein
MIYNRIIGGCLNRAQSIIDSDEMVLG